MEQIMDKLFYIGTYTVGTRSRGIYSMLIGDDGKLDGLATETNKTVANPSYLAVSGNNLYAVEEIDERDGGEECGHLVSFSIGSDGELEEIGRTELKGTSYCHVKILPDNMISASSYGSSGISLCPIRDDRTAGTAFARTGYSGSGPNAERQEAAHTHASFVDPSGRWLLVCDLGLDRIFLYSLEDIKAARFSDGAMLKERNIIEAPAGSGPRHLCFNHDGTRFYVAAELLSELLTYSFDSENGSAELLSKVSTLPEDFKDDNLAADVHLSESGNFLYVSNRGHNSIAVFDIDGKINPELLEISRIDVLGPRSFAVVGKYIIVAGQYSSNVVTYALAEHSGCIREKLSDVSVPTPVCICVKND